ncbi:MAG: glycosyltransferase family 2 protein [Alsobacter sp.]
MIPCLNEEHHIRGVVQFGLDELGSRKGCVVVVDGFSSDRTVAIVQDLAAADSRVKLVRNPARIQSAGVNLAVRQEGTGCDYILRLDAHAQYSPGLLNSLLDIAMTQGSAAVAVPMKAVGQTCFQHAAAAAQNSWLGNGGSLHRRPGWSGWVDHGHHALIRMSEFRQLEGYDPSFTHNEDAEFDRRLTMSGGKIWLSGNTPIIYFPRTTPTGLFRQYLSYGRGRCRTVFKHRVRLKLRQLIPLCVAPAALLVLASGAALPLILLGLALCLLVGALFSSRSRQFCDLFAGFAAVIMQVAWSVGFWWELGSRLRTTVGEFFTMRPKQRES